MSAQKSPDDLDALRIVIEAVKDFKQDDQKRIFRWAAEKLGLHQSFESPGVPPTQMHQSSSTPAAALQHTPPQDIKSFVAAKSPRNDVQFAATVAYYFQFEAPPSEPGFPFWPSWHAQHSRPTAATQWFSHCCHV